MKKKIIDLEFEKFIGSIIQIQRSKLKWYYNRVRENKNLLYGLGMLL